MKTLRHRARPGLAALLMTILLAGCVSTKERYEKGMELEAEGRYAEAAARYIRVLRDEPDWQDTRADLREAGTAAVNDYLDAANAAEAAGDYEGAFDALAALDALRADADRVDVPLPVPGDYADYRAEIREAAIASVFDRAGRAEAAGAWADALRAYERADQRYDLDPERHAAATEARGRVFVRWSEADLAHDHFRAAYDHAGHAVAVLGPDAPLSWRAREVQEDALAAGTRRVVFLPPGATGDGARDVPRDLLRTFGDVLQYEHWSAPPLFVAGADPAAVYRELRRLRYDRDRIGERIGERRAAEIGRALDADEVVVVDLTSYTWRETDLKTERRAARTRGRNALDTTFTVERYRVEVRGEAAYAILDARTRAVVARGTVRADADGRFERGRYAGEPRDLDLSRRDRDLFDVDAHVEAVRTLEADFADELAENVARRVYERLVQRVP